MKRIHAMALLSLGLFVAAAGASKPAGTAPAGVPDAVKQAFQQKYPAVANPTWAVNADHTCQASFTVQQAVTVAKFDATGKWLETKTAIPASAIPAESLQAVRAQSQGYKITATYSLQRPGTEGVTYEADLDNGKDIVKAEVSAEGAIMDMTTTTKP